MMRECTQLILISKKHNFLWSGTIPRWFMRTALIVLTTMILATIVLLAYNTGEMVAEYNIHRSEKEHAMLLSRLDSIQGRVGSLHGDFDKQVSSDDRERTYWQMAYIHPDIWQMGVGGDQPLPADIAVSNHTRSILEDIYQTLDVLKGKCLLRNASLTDIETQMLERQALWACIPSTHPFPGQPLGSGFGYRVDPINKRSIRMHWGVDIGGPRGSSILATADGIVEYTGWNSGYGLMIELDHGYGFRTRYAHCNSILVKKDDVVKRGQVIGTVGSTGRAVAPHLHYEVHVSGVKTDPKPYIDLSDVVFD